MPKSNRKVGVIFLVIALSMAIFVGAALAADEPYVYIGKTPYTLDWIMDNINEFNAAVDAADPNDILVDASDNNSGAYLNYGAFVDAVMAGNWDPGDPAGFQALNPATPPTTGDTDDYTLEITNISALIADSEAGNLKADGSTVMVVKAAIKGPNGEVDSSYAGQAEFVSKLGLKAAQVENSFDDGMVTFNVTLKNEAVDVFDEVYVRVKTGEKVGLVSETINLKYVAGSAIPGSGETTIRSYAVDRVKSTDMADRVYVYVGGVANQDVDAVQQAIVNQLKIHNTKGQVIDIVGIAEAAKIEETSVAASYAFTALLDLPAYNAAGYTLAGLQQLVMEDNAYNYYEVIAGNTNVRLATNNAVADNKFMLIDKFAPAVNDVIAFNGDEEFLPRNTLLVLFSEPVNRLTAEKPENWVINGKKLVAADVAEIRVLDIPTEELIVDDYSAVTQGKERCSVFLTLTNAAARLLLEDGENLLQARSIADWAGLTDLSDNNKITTQDFIFPYEKPVANPGIEITGESPEQFVMNVNDALFTDINATTLFDPTASGALNVQLLEPVTKAVIETLAEADYRIVPLPASDEYEYILELTRDWTQILKDNGDVAYHNKFFRVSLNGTLYDVYGNVKSSAAAPIYDELQIPEDTISPFVEKWEFAQPVTGSVTITMSEPLQLFDNNNNYVDPAPTVSLEQEQGTGVPVPTFEYVKVSQEIGDMYSAGTKIPGVIFNTPVNEHDVTFSVQPTKALEPGDWKLVARQISDDVGNTMSTDEEPFTIEGAPLVNNIVQPYVIWAYADDDKTVNGEVNDYVYVLYSRQMSVDAIRAATYNINGKQVTQDADITKTNLVLYRQTQNAADPNFTNFYGDGLDANGADINDDLDMMMWRGQLVTIKLPADFIVGGDDIDGDINGDNNTAKNALTLPRNLMAIDDGVDATEEQIKFDNNGGSNQFELTFDKNYGVTGYPVVGQQEFPPIAQDPYINYDVMVYATANAHFKNEPAIIPGENTTTVKYSITKPGFLFVFNVEANTDLAGAQYAVYDANGNQVSDKFALGTDAPMAPTVAQGSTVTVKIFMGNEVIEAVDVQVAEDASGSFTVEIPEVPEAEVNVTFTKPGFLYVANVTVENIDGAATFAVYDANGNQISANFALGTAAPLAPTVAAGDQVKVKIFDAAGTELYATDVTVAV